MYISEQDNFIMYDYLQQATNQKRLSSRPRPYPSARFHDMNSVEPWQKYTLQILIEDEPFRQVKTFYHTPKKSQHKKYYNTQRGFSFRNQKVHYPMKKTNSLLATERKSALSQYNINGNILGEKGYSLSLHPFQQSPKPMKGIRQKQKTINSKKSESSETKLKGYQSLIQIKRKIKLQKEKSNQGFVDFHCWLNEQICKQGNRHRKSKVISLGFQKLCLIRNNRQNSQRSKLSQAL